MATECADIALELSQGLGAAELRSPPEFSIEDVRDETMKVAHQKGSTDKVNLVMLQTWFMFRLAKLLNNLRSYCREPQVSLGSW